MIIIVTRTIVKTTAWILTRVMAGIIGMIKNLVWILILVVLTSVVVARILFVIVVIIEVRFMFKS